MKTALSTVRAWTPTKPILPHDGWVKMECRDNELWIYGTNSSIGRILVRIPSACDNKEIVCTYIDDTDKAFDLLSGDVTMKTERNRLVISSGRRKASLLTMDCNEYPVIDVKHVSEPLEVSGTELKSAVKTARLSVAKSHYVYENVYMGENGTAGADGAWMAVNKGVLMKPPILIPKYLADIITRHVGDEQVKISNAKGRMVISWGNTIIDSSIVNQDFPNYEDIIEGRKASTTVKVNRQAAIDVFSAIAFASSESDNLSLITIGEEKKEIMLQAWSQTKEFLDFIEEGNCEILGEPIVIGVSSVIMKSALADIESDIVQIEFSGSKSPIIMTDMIDRIYVIMPMFVSNR